MTWRDKGLAANAHLDPRADGVAVAFRAHQFQTNPVVMQILVVAQEQRRPADLREHHVEVAIAINVGEGRAASDDGFEQVRAGLVRRYGDKASAALIAGIPKQLGRLA